MATDATKRQHQVTNELLLQLGFEVTEERHRDQLDFRDLHIESVRDALRQAFAAGAAMRIEANGEFWVVEDPRADSTEADICWKTSLVGLERQFRGGWTTDRRPTLYLRQEEAESDAGARLALRNEFESRRAELRG